MFDWTPQASGENHDSLMRRGLLSNVISKFVSRSNWYSVLAHTIVCKYMRTCLIPCTQFTIHICPDLFTWTSTDHRCDWVAIANVCSDEYGGQWAGHIPMTIGNSTLLATGLVRRDTCMVSEDKGGEFRPARWATTLAPAGRAVCLLRVTFT